MTEPAAEADDNETPTSDGTSKSKRFKLQRSESDRVPLKAINEQSNSFKDTMRIKTMRKHYNKDLVDKLLLRPREPPPPPPPKNQTELNQNDSQVALKTNTVNTREDTQTENSNSLPKTIHMKLIKNNPDYESIKLFNKYELPSIPEEQKLSPVLNKKETGKKFVVNDLQSALLKDIKDKLARMEEKRAMKERSKFEDVEKDINDRKSVRSEKSNEGRFNKSKEQDVDKNYESPEYESYETIELKPTKIVETKNENKTEFKPSNPSAISKSSSNEKVKEESMKTVKNVTKEVAKEAEINTLKNNSSLLAKSPSTMIFAPTQTSTPIQPRIQSNTSNESKENQSQTSYQNNQKSFEDPSSPVVSTVSIVKSGKNVSTSVPSTPYLEMKDERTTVIPKKTSGKYSPFI